jgi:hypothetical protein
MLQTLLSRIKERLNAGAYPNEASVSHGIVMPVLAELGWDIRDPDQIMPEFTSGRGRVDFALCVPPRKPAIFVEVKGVGRSLEGDRQLFEYAFHEGVPLCVLTDGREWSFYLPSGQGNYEDRRIYRLQLDERTPAESEETFLRYLQFDRVRTGTSFESATSDYRDSAAKREAGRAIPQAWAELVAEPEELLVDLIADKAEAICGYRPPAAAVVSFLRRDQNLAVANSVKAETTFVPSVKRGAGEKIPPGSRMSIISSNNMPTATVFSVAIEARNGNELLVEVLKRLAALHPSRIEAMAASVRGRTRNHIGRTPADIYPSRPDLARAAEFAPGWLVGLNIANREKVGIVRDVCTHSEFSLGRMS